MSGIIGERIIVTEVVAYKDLAAVMKDGLLQNPRSVVIATYALCGFAHLAFMAIFAGGLSALAPGKTGIIAKVALNSRQPCRPYDGLCCAGAVFSQRPTLPGF